MLSRDGWCRERGRWRVVLQTTLHRSRSPRPRSAADDPGLAVEVLQKPMRRQLDLLVPELRRPVMDRDDSRPMHPPKVAEHECVPSFRAVRSAFGEAELPRRILLPRVTLEERVLVIGARLDLAPVAVQDVLA